MFPNIPGFVNDFSRPDLYCTVLHGFGINKSQLPSQHLQWLDRNLFRSMTQFVTRQTRFKHYTNINGAIWIYGLASRTGSSACNAALSKRRVSSMEHYANKALVNSATSEYFKIYKLGLGESLAAICGRKDEKESSLDRAVIVMAKVSLTRRISKAPPRSRESEIWNPKCPHVRRSCIEISTKLRLTPGTGRPTFGRQTENTFSPTVLGH